jgi:phytoene dehydrogenase-like protein
MGLSPSRLAAIAGFAYCKTIIMSSGYYPQGGMQAFSNALLDTFKGFGGEIIFPAKVTKIDVKDRRVVSVCLSSGLRFFTNYTVSTCDPIQTFFILIGKEHLNLDFIFRIDNIVPSPSAFIVFLGLNRPLGREVKSYLAKVYYPGSLSESRYDVMDHFDPYRKDMVFVPSTFSGPNLPHDGEESIYLFKIVPFKSKEYWDKNKFLLSENILDNAEILIPNLRKYIAYMEIATPYTLYKYTLNYNGASRGWGPVFSNTGLKMMDFVSPIKGLFLAGHWAPSPLGNGGISMSAYSGFQTAKHIKYDFSNKTT